MIIQCKDCLSKYNKQTTKSCPICRQPLESDRLKKYKSNHYLKKQKKWCDKVKFKKEYTEFIDEKRNKNKKKNTYFQKGKAKPSF